MDADVIIVGSGPGGLTAGIEAGRAGLSTILFEKDSLGGELVNRDHIANYPGVPDGIAGTELRSELVSTLEAYDPDALLAEVVDIEPGDPHVVRTEDDTYEAPAVILATGSEETHLDVPGEDEYRGRGVFYCAKCDGPLYQGETIAVVGGNDHALIDTQFLAGLTDRVILTNEGADLAGAKALREAVRAEDAVELMLETEVREITGENGVVDGIRVADVGGSNERTIEIGGLYAHVGLEPNTAFLDGTVPLTEDDRVEVGPDMQTEHDGIYAVGDIREGSPQMISAAVGDGVAAIHAVRQALE